MQRPAGHLRNSIFVVQGGQTIYSARIQGVSRSQLLGAGIAVCRQVSSNGQCYGDVLQCCTIANDQVPASEVYRQQAQPGSGFGGGVLGGSVFGGGVGGVGFPLGGGGGGGGVLGGSNPFGIGSGNALSFTDPNAANVLGASNSGNSRSSSTSTANLGSTTGLF